MDLFFHLRMPSNSPVATSSTVENAENVRRFREVGKFLLQNGARAGN